MKREIMIGKRKVGGDAPVFIIAEMSANHLADYGRAVAIIDAAKRAGADAVKLQTYTADTITIDCADECFQTAKDGLWAGMTLYGLYQQAYTPWEWQPKLKAYAESLGLICFSSPFDFTAVDFLAGMNAEAYKVASFEINDIPLIRRMARTGKPVIISTGIAYEEDIDEALAACRAEGNESAVLLKCTSAYPSPYEDMNIRAIPAMAERFGCVVGLSDHSMGGEVALGAVALGAKVIEKHMTLKRDEGGVDSAFSMEAEEFGEMTRQIRNLEKALGRPTFELTQKQVASRSGSRSLFAVADIAAGEALTAANVRSIRPGNGLHTRHYEEILGRKAARALPKGTPLAWDMIGE